MLLTAISCSQESSDGCRSLLGFDRYQAKEVELVLLKVTSGRSVDNDDDGDNEGEDGDNPDDEDIKDDAIIIADAFLTLK